MHDPLTQAFVIPYGWRAEQFKSGKKWRYWKPLITIWHKDPERGGSDDSCGWSRPRLTAEQCSIVNSLAGDEARNPWFMRLDAKTNDDPVAAEMLLRGAFHLVSRCLRNRGYRRAAFSDDQCARWASEMIHNPRDNFRSSLCFHSGYHSNWYREGVPNSAKEDEYFREQQAKSFFGAIMRMMLRESRCWFQHPRWHVWHWQFQFHAAQTFKRWAFSRCCRCGGRFTWGYSPCSGSWDSDGPQWFRSESNVYHGDCTTPDSACCADAAKVSTGKL